MSDLRIDSKLTSPPKPNFLKEEIFIKEIYETNPINKDNLETDIIDIANDVDIMDMIYKIRGHLKKIDLVNKMDFTTDGESVLMINGSKITPECMLHYLSGDKQFLALTRNQCSEIIQKYVDNKKLNLSKLLSLSGNFDMDRNFYKNLYNFLIAMIQFVANDKRFSETNVMTQKKLIYNLQKFTLESIRYLKEFMKKYNVIDDNLLFTSYELLLLINAMGQKRANVGKKIIELTNIYDKLIEAIKSNISLFEKINLETSFSEISQINNHNIENLANILKSKIDKLKIEREILQKNISSIEINQQEMLKQVKNPVILKLHSDLSK